MPRQRPDIFCWIWICCHSFKSARFQLEWAWLDLTKIHEWWSGVPVIQKKNHALSKTYLNPFGPWQALPTLEPPDHRCLFAMFVLWESVGYGCLLYLHFVLGGECFWRADSHEKGSLLHRQVSGFFKVARYWLPDHWQDWVGSSIFSKQKNISIEKIDLAWSWPTATQSEKSTITLNSGSAINYLQPSGFERCRRCHWSNAHGFPRLDSINRRSSLDFFPTALTWQRSSHGESSWGWVRQKFYTPNWASKAP